MRFNLMNILSRSQQLLQVSQTFGEPFSNLFAQQVRTNVRWFFEKPSEVKRIRKHGWRKRMSTPGGRKIIMNRILKGRHVLTH